MSHPNPEKDPVFDSTITQLKNANSHENSKNMPFQAKKVLRHNLVAKYDNGDSIDAQGQWQLWRFAGGAIIIALLGVFVVNIWLALSSQQMVNTTQSSQPSESTAAEPTTAVIQTDGKLFDPLPLTYGENLDLVDGILLPNPVQVGIPFELVLIWDVAVQPDRNYTVFVHVLDANGNKVAQAFENLDHTTLEPNGRHGTIFTLTIPDTPFVPPLLVEAGVTDPETQERLIATNGKDLVALGELTVEKDTAVDEMDVTHYATVTGTGGNGLHLRRSPTDQSIAILADGTQVELLYQPRREVDGLIWQLVKLADDTQGWVVSDFLEYPVGYEPAPLLLANQVWLISGEQASRQSATAPIELTLTLGVNLTTVDEATLLVQYANPEWDDSMDGRVPIDGISEEILVTKEMETVEVTATLNPQEMATIAQTEQPVLLLHLGVFEEADDGRFFKTLFLETVTNIAFDTTRTEQIIYGSP